MRASTRRSPLTQKDGRLPERLDTGHRLSGKIVRADEERVVVQRLSTRRFVIRIVQTDETVPEKRREFPTRFINLCVRRLWRLENLGYIRSDLHIGVMVVVDS